jgi:catechol 2,3-dioxygenase-like lactoylglutathione lyase family enzyme
MSLSPSDGEQVFVAALRENHIMKSITTVLPVPSIEKELPLWRDRLGFDVTTIVNHDDAMGFVILQRAGVEVMLQSHASLDADLGDVGGHALRGHAMLFIKVNNLDAVRSRLDDADIVMAERTTFYGSREIAVRSPSGHLIVLAEFADQD